RRSVKDVDRSFNQERLENPFPRRMVCGPDFPQVFHQNRLRRSDFSSRLSDGRGLVWGEAPAVTPRFVKGIVTGISSPVLASGGSHPTPIARQTDRSLNPTPGRRRSLRKTPS